MVRLKFESVDEVCLSFKCNSASLEMVLESSEDYLTSEMEKQKRKLKEMSKLMEQQHQLLRLIVQVCWELRFKIG
jgi:hypothetical protein